MARSEAMLNVYVCVFRLVLAHKLQRIIQYSSLVYTLFFPAVIYTSRRAGVLKDNRETKKSNVEICISLFVQDI